MKLIHPIPALLLFAFALAPALPVAGAITEEAVFTGPSRAALGSSVAVSGDTAVVGASSDFYSDGTGQPGAAYVYVRSGGAWTQQAVLTPSNPASVNFFGNAVAIEGNTIVVGAPGEKSNALSVNGNQADTSLNKAGAAYVFTRSGTTWTQQAYLKASNTRSNTCFGTAVAISGNTVAVGSGYPRCELGYYALGGVFGDSSNATGVDGNESNTSAAGAGAVYIFQREGLRWHQQAYVKASNTGAQDLFGSAVALSGDTLVVGAQGEDSGASGVNGNQADNSVNAAGAAYVFTRVNGLWSQQAYLKAQVPTALEGFGLSVALSGDTVAVGRSEANSPTTVAGVHVFTRSPAGGWSQQAAFTPLESGHFFGFSVALWRDTLLVGEDAASPSSKGAVHLFRRNVAGAWTRETVFSAASSAQDGGYGYSVAIEGDAVVVGSGGDQILTNGQNKAWMYGGAGLRDLTAEQPAGTALLTGGTREIAAVPGTPTDVVFTLRNVGAQSLALTGTPDRVTVSGSSDFTVTVQPPATLSALSSTTFTVHFAPATTGLKTAALSILSNDPDESPYVINLSGRGLSYTTDTDTDGMSDAAEFQLAALGFDWQAAQSALVNAYFGNANNNGLYTTSQVQALHVGAPLLQRNATTGKFTLTIGVKKTAVLGQPFTDFPMSDAGTSTVINGAGKLEFEFPSTGNAAFFRLESQ